MHTLIVTCAGDCDREPDDPDRCTCGIYGMEIRLACPAEDGTTVLDCGVWEPCGCIPRLEGPRLPDGTMSELLTGTGTLLDEYDLTYEWARQVQPTCPRTGLAHHQSDGELYVSTTRCFGRMCAETYDKASFEGLAIDQPGEYPITWYAKDGYAEWELVDEPVGAAA